MENFQFNTEDDYEFVLENYQGPIELLYDLIKESKLSIEEVKLGELTEQYIEHMKNMPELDIEEASKFIQVVAILLEIKTKMLLPKDADDIEDEEDSEYSLSSCSTSGPCRSLCGFCDWFQSYLPLFQAGGVQGPGYFKPLPKFRPSL